MPNKRRGYPVMFDRDVLEKIIATQGQWEENELRDFITRQPETRAQECSASGIPIQRLYTPADLADCNYEEIGLPGQYPFTRGPYPTMYRGRLWTMRQIAGYGTGEDTNRRFKYLIEQGQTGLSVDFDMPTLMGYDSDATGLSFPGRYKPTFLRNTSPRRSGFFQSVHRFASCAIFWCTAPGTCL